jgi:hypothetical protein
MALSRKFLSALGIEAEKIDEIIAAHSETVDGLKNELEQAKADAEKLKDVQKELDDLKKTAGTESEYKEKYEKEHAAFEKFKADTEAEKILASKKSAYRDILKDAGITADKAVEKVLRYTKFSELELDENGKFKDSAKLLKAVKEEWPELITTEGQKGADVGNPPANNGGSAFAGMSLADKMAYANAHPGDKEVTEWLRKPIDPGK